MENKNRKDDNWWRKRSETSWWTNIIFNVKNFHFCQNRIADGLRCGKKEREKNWITNWTNNFEMDNCSSQSFEYPKLVVDNLIRCNEFNQFQRKKTNKQFYKHSATEFKYSIFFFKLINTHWNWEQNWRVNFWCVFVF